MGMQYLYHKLRRKLWPLLCLTPPPAGWNLKLYYLVIKLIIIDIKESFEAELVEYLI